MPPHLARNLNNLALLTHRRTRLCLLSIADALFAGVSGLFHETSPPRTLRKHSTLRDRALKTPPCNVHDYFVIFP